MSAECIPEAVNHIFPRYICTQSDRNLWSQSKKLRKTKMLHLKDITKQRKTEQNFISSVQSVNQKGFLVLIYHSRTKKGIRIKTTWIWYLQVNRLLTASFSKYFAKVKLIIKAYPK